MADVPLNTTSSANAGSSSSRHDSVFVVENTDTDLASLFASIEKKQPASSEKAASAEPPSEPDPVPSKAEEPSVEVSLSEGKSTRKRALIFGLFGVVLAAATAVGARHFFFKPSLGGAAAKNPVQVRHSIAVPSAVERIEVFFPAQSKEKEDLLLMTVAVHTGRPNAEAILSSIRVTLRDAVYDYLSRQHPEKNVRRSWAPVVEKELLVELQKRFPQAAITAVELEDLQKI
ncbi:MAG: hypothetical protein WHS86_01520 [Desulfosoma sp.]